jgi:hypothetical protein
MRRITWRQEVFSAFLVLSLLSLVAVTAEAQPGGDGGDSPSPLHWLWFLAGGEGIAPLERAAVVAIALLAAFLTVVQTWKIPVEELRPGEPVDGGEEEAGDGEPEAETSAFTGNFSRTVLSGLGGMATVAILEPFLDSNDNAVDFKLYYAVWFVATFLSLLFASALLRGLIEAVRSRVLIEHRPMRWQGFEGLHKDLEKKPGTWRLFLRLFRIRYWWRRFWSWVCTYWTTFLVFCDTFFNVLQGRNQLKTAAVVEKSVVVFQKALIHAVDTVREEMDEALDRALVRISKGERKSAEKKQEKLLGESDVRVNISLLAADERSSFYISWARGSSSQSFGTHSLAWLVAYLGVVRWWRHVWFLPPDAAGRGAAKNRSEAERVEGDRVVVYRNQGGELPVPDPEPRLELYYQTRERPDYEAFVLLPLPSQRRGRGRDYRRGAVHISFKDEKLFQKFWPDELKLERNGDKWFFSEDEELITNKVIAKLAEKDPELGTVLQHSIAVLSELLRGFNDRVYQSYIRPQREG